MDKLAHQINTFFQSVCEDLQPLSPDADYTGGDECAMKADFITFDSVEKRLVKLDPRKAAGPDGIPTWILRDFAGYLAAPVASIFNSSIREGYLPAIWKCADIIPVPKINPPRNIEKDLRPISLTSVLSIKRAEVLRVQIHHATCPPPTGPIPIWGHLRVLN